MGSMIDLQEKLDRLEKVMPTDELKEFNRNGKLNGHYSNRMKLINQINKIKGLHRQVIFGDAPDCMINPQLNQIGEQV